MSSAYRVLCVSHDPALTYGEYRTPGEAEAAIQGGIEEHARCDLLIGRYSYPLVEVGCPAWAEPDRAGQSRCTSHSNTQWVDVVWLRILAGVHQSGTDRMRELADASQLRHWSRERLRRLRGELGIDVTG